MNGIRTLALVAMSGLWSAGLCAASPPWTEPKSDFGGAMPLNQADWYQFDDYPMSALSGDRVGMVLVGFTIGLDGRVTNCHVVQSSKHRDLDAVPCRVLAKRARFKPATDDQGQPRTTTATTPMSFWMPKR